MSDRGRAICERLHGALNQVNSLSAFCTGGKLSVPLPCLRVDCLSPSLIALPLQQDQANALSATCEQAPFGKGEQTIIDTSVRLCRQMDAARLTLSKHWDNAIQKVARETANMLGVTACVSANLYKLVLYEPGGFFKPHKDTEKEPGMFGTLVVQLPCAHEEGALLVRHKGEEKRFEFCSQSESEFYFAAFFADCEHELQEVKGGYRLVLIYNLVKRGDGHIPEVSEQECLVDEIVEVGKDWVERNCEPERLFVLMEHEYTEASLSFRNLKGMDKDVVEMLQRSKQFSLRLALIEKHVAGETSDLDFHYKRHCECDCRHDDTEGPHEMAEVIDTHVKILTQIDEDDQPSDYNLQIEEKEKLLSGAQLFDKAAKPDREDYGGYTGNAGASLDHWYHRAVIVVVPRARKIAMSFAGNFGKAVRTVRENVDRNPEQALSTLNEIILYAQRDKGGSQRFLADLLRMALLLGCEEHTKSALHTLAKSGEGCSTEERRLVLQELILRFGWAKYAEEILQIVTGTSYANISHCRALNRHLQTLGGYDNAVKLISHAILETAMEEGLETDSKGAAQIACTIAACDEERALILSKAPWLSSEMLSQVILGVSNSFSQDECIASSLMDLLEGLVSLYISKALTEKHSESPQDHAGLVFSLLLRLHPHNERLTSSFANALERSRSGSLLRAVLRSPQVARASDNIHVRRIAQLRASQLRMSVPQPTNSQPGAEFPGYPDVEDFLRGEQMTFEIGGFDNKAQAREFISTNIRRNGCHDPHYKRHVHAMAAGSGRHAHVVLEKINFFYKQRMAEFKASQIELAELRPLLTESSKSVRYVERFDQGWGWEQGNHPMVEDVTDQQPMERRTPSISYLID